MCVYAVLCAAAVHHGRAGVTVVACRVAANTERERRVMTVILQSLRANQKVNLRESEENHTALSSRHQSHISFWDQLESIQHFQAQKIKTGQLSVLVNHFLIANPPRKREGFHVDDCHVQYNKCKADTRQITRCKNMIQCHKSTQCNKHWQIRRAWPAVWLLAGSWRHHYSNIFTLSLTAHNAKHRQITCRVRADSRDVSWADGCVWQPLFYAWVCVLFSVQDVKPWPFATISPGTNWASSRWSHWNWSRLDDRRYL